MFFVVVKTLSTHNEVSRRWRTRTKTERVALMPRALLRLESDAALHAHLCDATADVADPADSVPLNFLFGPFRFEVVVKLVNRD